MKLRTKAFTLLELLVVIAIILLLSILAVIALASAREKARDAKRLTDMRDIQGALELYFLEHNQYPTVEAPIQLGAGQSTCFNKDGFNPPNCSNPFLSVIPVDPSGKAYLYFSEDGTNYAINATLEGEVNGLLKTIVVRPNGITNAQ